MIPVSVEHPPSLNCFVVSHALFENQVHIFGSNSWLAIYISVGMFCFQIMKYYLKDCISLSLFLFYLHIFLFIHFVFHVNFLFHFFSCFFEFILWFETYIENNNNKQITQMHFSLPQIWMCVACNFNLIFCSFSRYIL